MNKKAKKYLISIILLFIVAFVYLWQQIEANRMLRKLNRLHRIKEEEAEKYSQLQTKYAYLKSYKRLDAIAKKMKFVVPEKDKIIYLK